MVQASSLILSSQSMPYLIRYQRKDGQGKRAEHGINVEEPEDEKNAEEMGGEERKE